MAISVTRVPVVLFGCGGVGRALIRTILSNKNRHASLCGLEFELGVICDSSGFVRKTSGGFSEEETLSLLEYKENGGKLRDYTDGSSIEEFAAISNEINGPPSIIVDCSSGSASSQFLVEHAKKQGSVVCANKVPLCQSYDDFLSLRQNPGLFGYESTVGAGTPFIRTVDDIILGGDNVLKVQGMLSGTLGYVASALDSNEKSFSQIVLEAYNLGYTEPDPRDDLSGVDVARKALILARTCGLQLNMSDLNPNALYPETMSNLTVPEFLEALPSLDDEIKIKMENAIKQGKVLRYLASVDVKNGVAEVGLEAVDKTTPFGGLKGTANMMTVVTDQYDESNPLVVRGAGAGQEVTAKGVLSDMVRASFSIMSHN